MSTKSPKCYEDLDKILQDKVAEELKRRVLALNQCETRINIGDVIPEDSGDD